MYRIHPVIPKPISAVNLHFPYEAGFPLVNMTFSTNALSVPIEFPPQDKFRVWVCTVLLRFETLLFS